MFFFLQFRANIWRSFSLQTLEQPTYNLSCPKHGSSKLSPTTFRDCLSALLIVIRKLKRTGNGNLLKLNGKFEGLRGIRGMKTSSPAYFPVIIVPSSTWNIIFLITNLVPLHTLGETIFLHTFPTTCLRMTYFHKLTVWKWVISVQ